MQFVWTSASGVALALPVNAAEVGARVVTIARSQSGRPLRRVHALDVKSPLDGLGQLDLAAKETLARAVLQGYGDAVLLTDVGTPSGLALSNAQSLGGVVVSDGPHFRNAMGPEYVTLRTVEFTCEGEFVVPGSANVLVSFRQQVSVQGTGGPTRNWRVPINAAPIRQQISPYSIVRVVQQGEAVGHSDWPGPPAPLVDPGYLVHPASTPLTGVRSNPLTPKGPANWVEFPLRWAWVFEGPFVPNIVPAFPSM